MCPTMPITHDSVKLMNAMTNQRRSDESPLKRGVLLRARSLTEISGEFSHQKQQSAEVRTM